MTHVARLFSIMTKRKDNNSRGFDQGERQKARVVVVWKPSQSNLSVASQSEEALERLSCNGSLMTAQFVDATKPEPARMYGL